MPGRSNMIQAAMVCGVLGLACGPAQAGYTYDRLHSFFGGVGGSIPGPLTIQQTGAGPQGLALYGLATYGGNGAGTSPDPQAGLGLVYKLTPPAPGSTQWVFSRLYLFTGGPDGQWPSGKLAFDAAGSAYGTTPYGGTNSIGTVYRLSPPRPGQYFWTKTILHSFDSYEVGSPYNGVVLGPTGALFGVTGGRVYELTAPASGHGSWQYTPVLDFHNDDFTYGGPIGNVVVDPTGAVYGMTDAGRVTGQAEVFKLTPPQAGQTTWTHTTLYTFYPYGTTMTPNFVRNDSGTLFFVGEVSQNGAAAVFSLQPPAAGQTGWTPTLLHTFVPAVEGGPQDLGVVDNSGSVYGAAWAYSGTYIGSATIFRLDPAAAGQTSPTETVLAKFTDPGTYTGPEGALVRDAAGTLYTTTSIGGCCYYSPIYHGEYIGYGSIFRMTPTP